MPENKIVALLLLLASVIFIHNHTIDYFAHQVRKIASNNGVDTSRPPGLRQVGLLLVLSAIAIFAASAGESSGAVMAALLGLIVVGSIIYYWKDVSELLGGKYDWKGKADSTVSASETPSSPPTPSAHPTRTY